MKVMWPPSRSGSYTYVRYVSRLAHIQRSLPRSTSKPRLKTVPDIIQDIVLALEVADGSLPIKVPGLGACLKLVVGIYEEYQRLSVSDKILPRSHS